MATKYDFKTLTMRELAGIERLSGMGLSSFGSETTPKAGLLAAVAYTFKKRDNESFTFEAAQDLTLEEISEITSALGDLEISDGTEAA